MFYNNALLSYANGDFDSCLSALEASISSPSSVRDDPQTTTSMCFLLLECLVTIGVGKTGSAALRAKIAAALLLLEYSAKKAGLVGTTPFDFSHRLIKVGGRRASPAPVLASA